MSADDRTRWDERYGRRSGGNSPSPDPFLIAVGDRLPNRGRALDAAGGLGGNAAWLAARGLTVILADISGEALGHARRRADEVGVVIATLAVDLEEAPCPAGPWELIVCTRYLHRPLYQQFKSEIGPDGKLVVVHPTARNLERFVRPSRRFLLAEGELAELLTGWRIDHYEENWGPGPAGRHEARCLARWPGGPD